MPAMMRLLVMVAAVACAAPPKKAAPKKPQWHGCDEVRHWAASHRHDHTPATGWGGVFKGAVSHSQFGQDLVIVSIVQSLSKMNVSTWSPPFSYVDLATNDPLEGSNTFLLDACFSWKGVCVEPNAVYREAILEKRSCPLVDTCVSDEERTVKFVNDFSLGHVVGRRLKPELTELRCTTLRRILEGRSPRVTYLSLDVEGHDPLVLDGGMETVKNARLVEFEYHFRGAWARETLRSRTEQFEGMGFDCYLQGAHGSLWRLTGACFDEAFEVRRWANVVCVSRQDIAWRDTLSKWAV